MFGIDPVSWILSSFVNALIAAMGELMRLIEVAILNRPPIDEFPFYDEMGGVAVGNAVPIARIVLYFVLAAAVFLPKARGRLAPAALYAGIVTVVTPYWYRFVGSLQDFSVLLTANILGWFGNEVTVSPEGVQSAVGDLLQFNLNPFTGYDVVVGSFLLLGAFGASGILVAVVWCYAILTQVLAFFGLLAIALLSLGGRAEKFFQGIVAVSLVVILFGIPTIALILEAGIAFIDSPFWANLGGDSAFATGVVVNITFGLALLSQAVLLILFFKSTQFVKGKLRSIAAGGELNARLSGRDLSPDMNQNEAVSRALREPEMALAKENPSLVRDGVVQSNETKASSSIATQGSSPSAVMTRGAGSSAQVANASATGARVVPAGGIPVAGASGSTVAGGASATSVATPATAGSATAAGASTTGVGVAAVIGVTVAKTAANQVKERNQNKGGHHSPTEESPS